MYPRILLLIGCAAMTGAGAPAQNEAPDAAAPSAPAAIIHVTVEGIESDRGKVWVALCTTSLSIEGCPYQLSAPAPIGAMEVTFEPVPAGVYAVAGYHDLNGNEVFDTFFGIPSEPYALSGDAAEMLVPGFSDAALEMQPGENAVTIHMRRLGD